MRRRVIAVEPIQKNNARFSVFPRLRDDPIEDLASVEGSGNLTVAGIDQVIIFIFFHGLHEGFGKADGNVEIVELLFVGLAHDEIHDIRMVNPQDAHVGSPPCPPLLDRFRGHIKNAHKRNGAAGNTFCRKHDIIGGAQAGKRKTRTAAGFVNQRSKFYGIEDLFHGIAHRQDKAGRQLAQFTACVHQGG